MMSSSQPTTCPRCGMPIPAAAADQLCPACLMSGVLGPGGMGAQTQPYGAGESASGDLRGALPEPTNLPCELGGYRLVSQLGSGGMGAVYEAEQLATGRRVALKMLGGGLDSPDMRQRFLREGRLAARVNHPNSLYVFGSEEIAGAPVITMEVADYGTLEDALQQRGPLPMPEAVDAILDVIAGLEAAWEGGVLHRDIKPSNCFVGPDGSVKVGDFGLSVSTLARDDSYVTAPGMIMGTPAYAAPEQLQGDEVDFRADIYSVGATLFALLTGRPPFEGKNAVQVVANVMNQEPPRLSIIRKDVTPGLERVVTRCLAKEPAGRYIDYAALRDALLPFSSAVPEPSWKERPSAGWIDYLMAFLIPYLVLMLYAGAGAFHMGMYLERTFYSARYHLTFLCLGLLYFGITEGFWGAGLGKRLKGLRVIRTNGKRPGVARAVARIAIQIACIEIIRIPLGMLIFAGADAENMSLTRVLLYIAASNACPWICVLLGLTARPENGFATVWDLATGTRVVLLTKVVVRPRIESLAQPARLVQRAQPQTLGPYDLVEEVIPGTWVVANDPVLQRRVWLLRRSGSEPSVARRNIARAGRLRWLQKVETDEATWDAFEATKGQLFSSLTSGGKRVSWATLRHWLHDLASELWSARKDDTLPAKVSLDHVWISERGQAMLLDQPWPAATAAESFCVAEIAGEQRFLNAVAAFVEPTSIPLHARPVLKNLAEGRFEKLSFLTGTLRGLLDKPADVGKGVRAGAIFMLPVYTWILSVAPRWEDFASIESEGYGALARFALMAALVILTLRALVQLLELPFRTTMSHSTFRLAVVDAQGELASIPRRLLRWAIVWLTLLLPIAMVYLLTAGAQTVAFCSVLVVVCLWFTAAFYAVLHPHRGWHDRIAGTWVVRR